MRDLLSLMTRKRKPEWQRLGPDRPVRHRERVIKIGEIQPTETRRRAKVNHRIPREELAYEDQRQTWLVEDGLPIGIADRTRTEVLDELTPLPDAAADPWSLDDLKDIAMRAQVFQAHLERERQKTKELRRQLDEMVRILNEVSKPHEPR